MKQLPLLSTDGATQTTHSSPWKTFPRIVAEPLVTKDFCYLQAVHSFRKNKYLLHFVYVPSQRVHVPNISNWRKQLRRYRIGRTGTRLVRRISKLIVTAAHHNKVPALPSKLQKQYDATLRGKIRFKIPKKTSCVVVESVISANFTAGFAEMKTIFVPQTDQLLVARVVYTRSTARSLGLVGVRREAILEKIKQHSIAFWNKQQTYALFD